jgi:hypothetical protein
MYEINGVLYKQAEPQEVDEVYTLLYDSYLRAGLAYINDSQRKVTKWHSLPTTSIYIAKDKDAIIYTVTLILDSEQGLPIEEIFKIEINAFREQKIALAEVSCLASKFGHLSVKENLDILINLIKLLILEAREKGVDQLVLSVHPSHAKFYERFFGCYIIGPPKEYSIVMNNLAVLCVHNFLDLDIQKYKVYDRIYDVV